jgi:hypothetical protein
MPHQELIPLGARGEWAAALQGIPHGFHHTWEHCKAWHVTTGYRTFLYCFRDRGTRMLCPLVERELAGYIDIATPSGLAGFVGTGSWSRFAPHWSAFVREQGYVSGYIGLHPLFEPADMPDPVSPHNSLYVLDLKLGREELLRRMDRNRRRELRGWERRASDFVLDRDVLGQFLSVTYEPFMREVGARPPHLSVEALDLLCRSETCLAVGSRSDSGLGAVYVFGATPYVGDCLINVATPEGRRRATDLLWYGACALADRQVPLLNLGGGARDDDSVARAKQRFRPDRLPLRALREVYRPSAYADLCRIAGVEPTAASDYFPAYRSPLASQVADATT